MKDNAKQYSKFAFNISIHAIVKDNIWYYLYICRYLSHYKNVAPGFNNKTRYTLYLSSGSQITHMATNKG
jgi:hypothetical protein